MRQQPNELTPRNSICVNLRQPQRRGNTRISLLARVFVSVSIIAIVYSLVCRQQAAGEHHGRQEPVDLLSKEIVTRFQTIRDVQLQSQGSPRMPPIPLVPSRPTNCEKTKKQQLEESLSNIRVFEILRGSLHQPSELRDKLFIQVKPLFAIEHPKFTSPSIKSDLGFMSLGFWNPFGKQQNKYDGVHKIYEHGNKVPWKSGGKYITMISDEPIKPAFLILDLPGQQPEHKWVYLYGIQAIESSLVNKYSLESTFIKKAKVYEGSNLIECDEPACVMPYSMLMLILDPVEIVRLEVYADRGNYNAHMPHR